MNIMKIIGQAKNILFNPKGTLLKLRDEQVTMNDIIFYLVIVGAPTFLGILLGYGLFWWGGSGSLAF